MARKIALLIGNNAYKDEKLARLEGPPLDVHAFAEVLRDPAIGAFDEVTPLLNASLRSVRDGIFDLFEGRDKDDLLLLYFAGHGVLDIRGRLYLAVGDTHFRRLRISALPASELHEHMNESRSRRQVLILDCCHSGAVRQGARRSGDALAITEQTFGGYGREVLTSSTGTQYAFEGDTLVEGEAPSGLGTFTHYLVEGLRTGACAPESESISVLDLFDYASRKVREANTSMTPQRWSDFRDDRPLLIARNPNPRPIAKPIPEDISERLNSSDYITRSGAVFELHRRATLDIGLVRSAIEELEALRLRERDVGVLGAIDQWLPVLRGRIEAPVPVIAVEEEASETEPATQSEPAGAEVPEPGTVFRDVDAPWCPDMVVIPAGRFHMGSPKDEEERDDDEGPQQEVTIARPFALGKYPVTFEEYDHFCRETGREPPGDEEWGRGRRPVINVLWEDAQDYVAWLSEATGESYRLPSEAEWEYACRAGTTTRYWWGDKISSKKANYGGNLGKTSEVGEYAANPWGLFDMHGNVLEWVEDRWHDDYRGAPNDGSTWVEGDDSRRVLRGGSWDDGPRNLRSADRDGLGTGYRIDVVGFRVARTLTA